MTFLLTLLIGTSGVLIVSALFDTSLTDTVSALWQGNTPAFKGGIINTNTQTPSQGASTFGSGLVPIQL